MTHTTTTPISTPTSEPLTPAEIDAARAEGIAEGLAVAAMLLRRIIDHWDGRPIEHIEADLRDVLTAIEADRDYNATRTVQPAAGNGQTDGVQS